MIDLVGVPFDLCGYRPGSRLGPAAVRLAGLVDTLNALGVEVKDLGDCPTGTEQTVLGGLRNFEPALEAYKWVKSIVAGVCDSGHVALCLGGDHSLSIGSVSGARHVYGSDLAVLWIDAHTDLNTPDTSPSGNLHGMGLGALLGQPCKGGELPAGFDRKIVEEQWTTILGEIVGDSPVNARQVGWLGVRDVDLGERSRLRRLDGEYMATMYDIDRYSLVEMMLRADSWLKAIGARKVWVSFDVDALDPFLAPGTGTAVRGGLSYREMHLMGELLNELLAADGCPYSLAGIDLVETNPLVDSNNETAKMAVEWIASVFGKTILGKR